MSRNELARQNVGEEVISAARAAGISEEHIEEDLDLSNVPIDKYTFSMVAKDLATVASSNEGSLNEAQEVMRGIGYRLKIPEDEEEQFVFNAYSEERYTTRALLADVATVSAQIMVWDHDRSVALRNLQETMKSREQHISYLEDAHRVEMDGLLARLNYQAWASRGQHVSDGGNQKL